LVFSVSSSIAPHPPLCPAECSSCRMPNVKCASSGVSSIECRMPCRMSLAPAECCCCRWHQPRCSISVSPLPPQSNKQTHSKHTQPSEASKQGAKGA
jgi:hypothetical protein